MTSRYAKKVVKCKNERRKKAWKPTSEIKQKTKSTRPTKWVPIKLEDPRIRRAPQMIISKAGEWPNERETNNNKKRITELLWCKCVYEYNNYGNISRLSRAIEYNNNILLMTSKTAYFYCPNTLTNLFALRTSIMIVTAERRNAKVNRQRRNTTTTCTNLCMCMYINAITTSSL